MNSLTSRDRVQRALEHRDHDRVPRFDVFWPETLTAWRTQGLGDAVPAQLFNFDIATVGHLAPVPFPGRNEVIREDEHTVDFINPYGATFRRWKTRSGVPTHLGYECTDRHVWSQRFKPLFAQPTVDVIRLMHIYTAAKAADRWTCIGSRGPLCFIQTLVGDETLFLAMAEDPQWVTDMADTVTDAMIAQYTILRDAGILTDGLWVFDDLAYRNGPFMSPAMYRQMFGPQHRRMAAFAHQHDMKFIFHTDGDVRSLLDELLDMHIDALQPLEAKANMDVRSLAPTIGSRVSLFGNIDMTVASLNDRDRLEHELTTKLQAAMPTRGYLYHSDHSVPPQVTFDTYRHLHTLLDQHATY